MRPHLAAIIRHVRAGNEVMVGGSEKTAWSCFVSLEEFQRRQSFYRVKPQEIDVEEMRRCWSRERELVENSGLPVRILRKGEPFAMFIPTRRALEKKVPRTLETLDRSEIETLDRLGQRVTKLEAAIDALSQRTLDEEAMREFRQAIGVTRVVLRQWRESQGLPGSLQESSTN